MSDDQPKAIGDGRPMTIEKLQSLTREMWESVETILKDRKPRFGHRPPKDK